MESTWDSLEEANETDVGIEKRPRPPPHSSTTVTRYLTALLASAETVSGSTAGSVGRAGADGAAGIGARPGSPASGTLPDAAISRGCSSNATSPVQPV